MSFKKLMSVSLIFVFAFMFIYPRVVVKSFNSQGQSFGIVKINGKEAYKSKSGEIFPIVMLDGKRYIVWHGFDLVSVEDVINCESGKADLMLGNYIDEYQKEHPDSKNFNYNYKYSSGEKAGYNQTYSVWSNLRLGFSSWDENKHWWKYTIGNAGCFLCATASELLRYNLKDPVSHQNVNPVNLNEWLKNNGGFVGADLRFEKIRYFPGISYVINGFDDFNGAARILYQSPPNAPIICFRSQHPDAYGQYHYHFCLYIQGDAINPYYWDSSKDAWELNKNEAPYHRVIDSGFNNSSDMRGTIRDLAEIREESKYVYVRPDSGIFRVAFKQ